MGPEDEPAPRALLTLSNLSSLARLYRSEIRFKDADPAVASQTSLERSLAAARPELERLGAGIMPFMATAYERSCEVIAVGKEAVCGSTGRVSIVDLEAQRVRWSQPVEGSAIGLAVADGMLLVSTTTGLIYCYAETNVSPSSPPPAPVSAQVPPKSARARSGCGDPAKDQSAGGLLP